MEGEFENGDVEQFTLKIKKVMDPKEIALHFMLHINEEFNDDLLQDALELLDYIWSATTNIIIYTYKYTPSLFLLRAC